MKTNFETPEEIGFLIKLYYRGIESTDKLFNFTFDNAQHLFPYINKLIYFRKKCFEGLEQNDPNQQAIDIILKNIQHE